MFTRIDRAAVLRLVAGTLFSMLPLSLACTTTAAGASAESCVAGATSACACDDGRSGAQTCNATGAFDACACNGTSDGKTTRPADTTKDAAEEEATSPDAPVFLSLGTSVKTITEDESVTITAVLTDPDGIDDLIGGSLTSEDGKVQYGAFATSGQEGAYSLVLSWSQINDGIPIFLSGSKERIFRAEFYDEAGHKSSRTVSVALTCGDLVACDGVCSRGCKFNYKTPQSCDDACASAGMTCTTAVPNCRTAYYLEGTKVVATVSENSCTKVPPAVGAGERPFASLDCCCLP